MFKKIGDFLFYWGWCISLWTGIDLMIAYHGQPWSWAFVGRVLIAFSVVWAVVATVIMALYWFNEGEEL